MTSNVRDSECVPHKNDGSVVVFDNVSSAAYRLNRELIGMYGEKIVPQFLCKQVAKFTIN